jgi:hypothetical protein
MSVVLYLIELVTQYMELKGWTFTSESVENMNECIHNVARLTHITSEFLRTQYVYCEKVIFLVFSVG